MRRLFTLLLLLGILLSKGGIADRGCRVGYAPFRIPAGGSAYDSAALQEGARSAAQGGDIVCAATGATRDDGPSAESAQEPIRAYLPDRPNQDLSLRRELLTLSVPSVNATQSAAPGSEPELAQPSSVFPLPSLPTTTLGQLSSPEQTPNCGGINLPSLPPRLDPILPGTSNGMGSGRSPASDGSDATPPGTTAPPAGSPTGPEENPAASTGALPLPQPGSGQATSPAPFRDFPNALRPQLDAISEGDRRQDFYQSLLQSQNAVRDAARNDAEVLSETWKNANLDELQARLKRAQEALRETGQQIENGTSLLPEGERIRFSRTYQNAADKAQAASELTQSLAERKRAEENRAALAGENPILNFLLQADKSANPLARSAEIENLLGRNSMSSAATSQDGLNQRLIMLGGLDPQKRREVAKGLKLSEPLNITLQDGSKVDIPLLHNGYILGGGRTGLDCSSFVSAALPPDIRKGRFTTWDFRTMWVYRRSGTPPKDPKYEPKRLSLVLDSSKAFDALDLYRGDEPEVGDLLVHRLPWENTGHVFVVRNWHRNSKIASVIEAAQSAGTIREREFPLSLDPQNSKRERLIRPGLMLLRIRPVKQKVCNYRRSDELLREPAEVRSPADSAAPTLPPGGGAY